MSVCHAIGAAVQRCPDGVALLDEGGTALTYQGVWDVSSRVAAALCQSPLTCVALLVQDGPLLPVCMLACWRCGIPFVPVDARSPPARNRSLVASLNIGAALVGGGALPDGLELLPHIDVQSIVADKEGSAPASTPVGETEGSVSHYITTSGTTGEPKVVQTGQEQLFEAAQAKAAEEGLGAGSRVLLASHLTFDPCQVDTAAAWVSGAALVAPPRATVTSWQFASLLQTQQVTHVCCTPTQWRLVERGCPDDFPSLQCLTLGGESFPESMRTWAASHITLRNTYGLTEGTGYQSSARVSPDPGAKVTIGHGFGSYSLSVEDGEVVVRGCGLSHCHGEPALPALRTGDLGIDTPDGIVLLGRRDSTLKVKGQRINLEEIDAVARRCSIVSDAIACVVDGAIGVCVTRRGNYPRWVMVTAVELQCRAHLPYYAVPTVFGVPKKLVLSATPSGKVNREEVSELVRKDHQGALQRQEAVPHATALESLVGLCWETVLGGGSVGREHNFNHLGGDSLAALRVCNQLRRRTTLRDKTVFAPVTAFEGVASMLVQAEAPSGSVCELAEVMGPYAPCELLARPLLRNYAQFLCDSGVEVEDSEDKASTASNPSPHAAMVIHSCKQNDEVLLQTLLDVGVTVEAGSGWGPLHEAAAHAEAPFIARLLEALHGPVPTASLHVAAARGKAAILTQLLAAGADATQFDEDGQSILHLASRSGDEESVIVALDAVQDTDASMLNHVDLEGHTALSWAILNGHMDVAKLLVEKGVLPRTDLERSAVSGEDQVFGRVKRKGQRGAAKAHRKTERGGERLSQLMDALRTGSHVLEALREVRDICCAVQSHRLLLMEMGLADVLMQYLWPPSLEAAAAAGIVRNVANDPGSRETLVQLGYIEPLARLLKESNREIDTCWRAAGALGKLATSPSSWESLVTTGAARIILDMGGRKLGLPDDIVKRVYQD